MCRPSRCPAGAKGGVCRPMSPMCRPTRGAGDASRPSRVAFHVDEGRRVPWSVSRAALQCTALECMSRWSAPRRSASHWSTTHWSAHRVGAHCVGSLSHWSLSRWSASRCTPHWSASHWSAFHSRCHPSVAGQGDVSPCGASCQHCAGPCPLDVA